jgi:hypothetical protein
MGEGLVLSAVYITYQCIKLDYCYEESMRASLDLCDKVYVNDGQSTDGTLDVLKTLEREYGKDRFILYEKPWKHDRAFWTEERNFLLDKIPSNDYVLNIAADECFHERDFAVIRGAMSRLGSKNSFQFKAVHFYGLPSYVITGPAWAKVLTKMWRNDTGIKYYNRPKGCADDPLWPDGQPVHFARCMTAGVPAYHYGHCRHPKAVATKNEKAHSLYRGESTYSDGSFPEIESYDYQLEEFKQKGGAQEFKGTHPKYMQDWVAAHANQKTYWSSK